MVKETIRCVVIMSPCVFVKPTLVIDDTMYWPHTGVHPEWVSTEQDLSTVSSVEAAVAMGLPIYVLVPTWCSLRM